MKKINVKSFVAGFLIAALLFAVPAGAAMTQIFFTNVRINVDGVDRVTWGEEIETANGEIVPYSLVYHDTVYIPLRALGELIDKQVYWNGDATTVTIVDNPNNIRIITEHPDRDGNMWEYSTFSATDGNTYLRIRDKARGYARVYLTASNSVYATDDAIYFARLKRHTSVRWANQATLVKISFDNIPDTQDGVELFSLYPINSSSFAIDGNYVFYGGQTSGNGPHAELIAFNYVQGLDAHYSGGANTNIFNIKVVSSDGTEAVLQYHYETAEGETYLMQTTFYKAWRNFSTPKVMEIVKNKPAASSTSSNEIENTDSEVDADKQ